MNMVDYLHWRGDLSFSAAPFNEVDNLILSYLSYVDLRCVFDENKKEATIKQASDIYYIYHTMEEVKADKSFIAAAPIVLLEAAKTNRYQNMKIHHYADVLDKESTTQFSAMQFDIDENTIYIAFRGTDDTLVGWKEDLQLSYQNVNAQSMSVEYMNQQVDLTKQLIVGGHSKGGHIALYAAAGCNDEVKKQIIKVYNNDGPNLHNDFMEEEKIHSILPITLRIVPGFSIFGLIFDHDEYQTKVIRSNENLIMQHDAMSWQIEGPEFVSLEKVSDESIIIRSALNNFLDDTDKEQRKTFTESFFDAIDEAGFSKMSEFATIGFNGVIKLIRNLASSNQDPIFKQVVNRMVDILKEVSSSEIDKITSSASNSIKEKVNSIQEDVKSKTDDIKSMTKELSDKVNSIEEDIKSRTEDIKSKTKEFTDDVTDKIRSVIPGLKSDNENEN